jgi:hypothetical protein
MASPSGSEEAGLIILLRALSCWRSMATHSLQFQLQQQGFGEPKWRLARNLTSHINMSLNHASSVFHCLSLLIIVQRWPNI